MLQIFNYINVLFRLYIKGGIFINDKPRFFIGIDTHKRIHTASVINHDVDKLLTFTFENEPRYFTDALSKILKVTKSKDIIFGLEDTMSFGLLFSQYLTSMQFEVKQVNPALANAYRSTLPNYHKSDAFDAFCVAKVLKDEYKRLPNFNYCLLYSNIKLLSGMRDIIIKQQSLNYILLHQQLTKMYPGYSKFFKDIHGLRALSFFEHFPSPRYLKGYTKELLAKEMRLYRRGFPLSKAEDILSVVRQNPIPYVDKVVETTIVQLIEDIYNKEERVVSIEKQLEELVDQTGYKLQTMPCIKIATAARIIAEIGDINRFKDERQLAKYAGISPTSVGSGGKNKELVAKGGNRELRATFYFLAVGMIGVSGGKPRNELFRKYFVNKVASGKTKPQALICVMRQITRIIYAMMKNKSEYIQPEKKKQK